MAESLPEARQVFRGPGKDSWEKVKSLMVPELAETARAAPEESRL